MVLLWAGLLAGTGGRVVVYFFSFPPSGGIRTCGRARLTYTHTHARSPPSGLGTHLPLLHSWFLSQNSPYLAFPNFASVPWFCFCSVFLFLGLRSQRRGWKASFSLGGSRVGRNADLVSCTFYFVAWFPTETERESSGTRTVCSLIAVWHISFSTSRHPFPSTSSTSAWRYFDTVPLSSPGCLFLYQPLRTAADLPCHGESESLLTVTRQSESRRSSRRQTSRITRLSIFPGGPLLDPADAVLVLGSISRSAVPSGHTSRRHQHSPNHHRLLPRATPTLWSTSTSSLTSPKSSLTSAALMPHAPLYT